MVRGGKNDEWLKKKELEWLLSRKKLKQVGKEITQDDII